MAEFASGRLSQAAYRQRMEATTTEQLALLTNDPQFHAWQSAKAARENRARVATNLLAVAGCVLLAVTMALLKPAAVAGPQVGGWMGGQCWWWRLVCRQGWSEGLEGRQLGVPRIQMPHLKPRQPLLTTRPPRPSVPFHPPPPPQVLPAPQQPAPSRAPEINDAMAAAAAQQGLQPAEVYRVLETVSYRLDSAREENEAAWDTISDLSLQLRAAQEAKQAQAERLAQLEAAQAAAQLAEGEGEAEGARLAARLAELASEVAAAKEAAAAVGPWLALQPVPAGAAAVPVPFSNASFALPATSPFPPSPTATATGTSPAALYTFLAALACGALAALVYLRGRRAAAAEAGRALALGARLKEAAFAKDTAEQSLALLECELQRRMKQLEEAQQRAADAGVGCEGYGGA